MEYLVLLCMALMGSMLMVFSGSGQGSSGRNMPEYLEVLLKAEHLDDSAIGYAAQRSEIFQAFERALSARDSIRGDLEWLVKNASPAGRIYSAILIDQIDKEAGRKVFESLKIDKAMVNYRSGSLVEDRTVGELAEDLLRGETIIIFRPPAQ
jgi:hypothetical protein